MLIIIFLQFLQELRKQLLAKQWEKALPPPASKVRTYMYARKHVHIQMYLHVCEGFSALQLILNLWDIGNYMFVYHSACQGFFYKEPRGGNPLNVLVLHIHVHVHNQVTDIHDLPQ